MSHDRLQRPRAPDLLSSRDALEEDDEVGPRTVQV